MVQDIYSKYVEGLYTDVVFKGFYATFESSLFPKDNEGQGASNSAEDRDGGRDHLSQCSNSEDENSRNQSDKHVYSDPRSNSENLPFDSSSTNQMQTKDRNSPSKEEVLRNQ